MMLNAQVILIRCKSSKNLYGARIQQRKGINWDMTWSFPIDDKRAKNEGFDKSTLNVDCCATEEYPGCPTCGSKGYVRCASCGKLTCWSGENTSKCAWCNEKLYDIAYRGAMDISVGDDLI